MKNNLVFMFQDEPTVFLLKATFCRENGKSSTGSKIEISDSTYTVK
ncbi:hypothetical protein V8V75_14845 [Peribacillus frigoritolerans]